MAETDYQSRDTYLSQLRERIRDAEKDYPRLDSVVKGETTLTDIVNEYETRFYQLLNHKTVLLDGLRPGSKKKLQDCLTEYISDFNRFSRAMMDISVISGLNMDDAQMEDYVKRVRNDMKEDVCGCICLGSLTATFLGSILPPLWPLIILGGGCFVGSLFATPYPSNRGGSINAKKHFKEINEYAGMLDSDIRSAYAVEHFMSNRELFMETYRQGDNQFRDYINKKLMGMLELGGLNNISASQLEKLLKNIKDDRK